MARNFILYFIPIILYNSINCLKCAEQNIPHCLQCGIGEDNNKCTLCEDKYFLFFHNLICQRCNDLTYGQIGCGGNCDGSQIKKTKIPLCYENDCFQEFFNIEGICYKCNETSPHCSKCSYDSLNGSKEKIFKCLSCDEPDLKVLNKKDGKCHKCFVNHCKKCNFDINDNDICEECENGYYVNNGKTCSECGWVNITGGKYYYCPDKISEIKSFECYGGYAKNGTYNCLSCPTGCSSCSMSKQSLLLLILLFIKLLFIKWRM